MLYKTFGANYHKICILLPKKKKRNNYFETGSMLVSMACQTNANFKLLN